MSSNQQRIEVLREEDKRLLERSFAGKTWVYVVSCDMCNGRQLLTLAVAVQNEPAWHPVPWTMCACEADDKQSVYAMARYVERLNEEHGFGPVACSRVVTSTYAAQQSQQRALRGQGQVVDAAE